MDLDDKDRALLVELTRDARRSARELAEAIGTSAPTVTARLRRLEAIGLIRGYRADLDPSLMGAHHHVVHMQVDPAKAHDIAAELSALPGVTRVTLAAGGRLDHEHVASAQADVHAHFAALAPWGPYEARPLIGAWRGTQKAPPPTRVEVACHQCGGPIAGAGVHRTWQADERRNHWFCCQNCARQFGQRLERHDAAGAAKDTPATIPERPRRAHGHGR